MKKMQVLVATMHQNDVSLAEKMNIRSSAVIANQADREEIVSCETEFGNIKMITTATRGVGLNRNIALMAADAEILLFSDDDVVYNDDVAENVTAAFETLPQADVIVFGMDIVKNGKITERRHLKRGRLRVWNAMRFGTYTVAVRRSSVIKKNVTFNQCFGGGCPFSAGEDTLFLKSCFDAGLKVYSYDYVLGTCCKDSSSWFVGYNEKYFYDKGVLVRNLFPKTAYVMALYFGIRFKRHTELGVLRRVQLMIAGVNAGKNLTPYRDGI
jgi:glycosyltransferase involved in cell wall biosynthesis